MKKSTSLRTSARFFTPSPCPHVFAFDQTLLPRLCGRPLWTAPKRNFNMTLVENQYDDSLLQRVNEAQFLYDATWKPIIMMIAIYSEFIKRTTNMMIPFYSALFRRKINMTLEQGCRDPF